MEHSSFKDNGKGGLEDNAQERTMILGRKATSQYVHEFPVLPRAPHLIRVNSHSMTEFISGINQNIQQLATQF